MIEHWPDGWEEEDYREWVKPYTIEELPEHLRKYKKPVLDYSYLKSKYQPGQEQFSGPLTALSVSTAKYIESNKDNFQLQLQVGEWLPELNQTAVWACVFSKIAVLTDILKDRALYEYYWLAYKMILPMEDLEAAMHAKASVFSQVHQLVKTAYSSMLEQAKEKEKQTLAAFPECANYGLKPILTNVGNSSGKAYQIYLPIQQPNVTWQNPSE